MYAEADDPWGFRDRPYEARKRALTLASLPRARYGAVFEPGCSIGNLTVPLAARADRVLAMDPAAAAVHQATAAVPDNVVVTGGSVPADWPRGRWDLVVLSEVGYYLDRPAMTELASQATVTAADLVAVHWRHPVADYPLGGDEVHAALGRAADDAGMTRLVTHEEEDFLLAVWSHDDRSVARRDGLVG
jgi:SAM-dependent methyltransferase